MNNLQEDLEQDVEEKVKDLVAELFEADRNNIDLNARFVEDLKADSLDNVEMVMALEEAFDIEIPEEEYEKILTIGAAVEYVKAALAKKGS